MTFFGDDDGSLLTSGGCGVPGDDGFWSRRVRRGPETSFGRAGMESHFFSFSC